MNVCTAVGAIDSKKNYTITFKSEAHKIFYLKYLPECRYQDVYHKALVYCLGIDADTRNHVNSIYDFKTGCVKTKCLNEGWQNSGSIKIVRMAFNLYCNGTPSVHDFGNAEERLQECGCYTVEELFCCGYAKYFWEAVKIRYPEYCCYTGLEATDMLKIRLQGTTNDIKWFKKILERDKRITVLDISETYANKGTKKYFRMYAEVEKNRQ